MSGSTNRYFADGSRNLVACMSANTEKVKRLRLPKGTCSEIVDTFRRKKSFNVEVLSYIATEHSHHLPTFSHLLSAQFQIVKT
jgi:hypothetical protein